MLAFELSFWFVGFLYVPCNNTGMIRALGEVDALKGSSQKQI